MPYLELFIQDSTIKMAKKIVSYPEAQLIYGDFRTVIAMEGHLKLSLSNGVMQVFNKIGISLTVEQSLDLIHEAEKS
jgi:hypothetical protein